MAGKPATGFRLSALRAIADRFSFALRASANRLAFKNSPTRTESDSGISSPTRRRVVRANGAEYLKPLA